MSTKKTNWDKIPHAESPKDLSLEEFARLYLVGQPPPWHQQQLIEAMKKQPEGVRLVLGPRGRVLW